MMTTSTDCKRKAKSCANWIWNHFKLVKDFNKFLIMCLHRILSRNSQCSTLFLAKTETSSLFRHFLLKHNISKSQKSDVSLQTFFSVNDELRDPYELNNESKEANLNALIAFVMDHQQAINLVEKETFWRQYHPIAH